MGRSRGAGTPVQRCGGGSGRAATEGEEEEEEEGRGGRRRARVWERGRASEKAFYSLSATSALFWTVVLRVTPPYFLLGYTRVYSSSMRWFQRRSVRVKRVFLVAVHSLARASVFELLSVGVIGDLSPLQRDVTA